ncbi:hypothetical protein BAE44_0010026 [Dichanthelium oligosanthes]|uniref:Uncharacterized protein n=1 Tax=Dichanthelium oligosanthes TaxID=888268 RepID=A0A1E5VUZ4_9POAL|nr:hypothetical protein BAE44_0010026 [Dichanthelium oligosanthes]
MVQGVGSCSSFQGLGVPRHGGRRTWPDFPLMGSPAWRRTVETSPGVCVNIICTGAFPAKRQGLLFVTLIQFSLSRRKDHVTVRQRDRSKIYSGPNHS